MRLGERYLATHGIPLEATTVCVRKNCNNHFTINHAVAHHCEVEGEGRIALFCSDACLLLALPVEGHA